MGVVSVCARLLVAVVVVYSGGAESQTSITATAAAATTAATTTNITTTAATAAAECKNTIPNCHYHRREEICQGIYKPWASARCALYCGFCKPPEGYAEACEDIISNCAQYRPCDDPSFFVWVEDHCRKYCHRCGNGSQTATTTTTAKQTTSLIPQVTPQLTTAPSSSLSTGQATTTSSTGGHGGSSKGTTQSVVSPGSTAPEVSPSCQDRIPFCNRYAKSSCHNTAWATAYCARYCNLCDAVSGTSTKPQVTTSPQTGTAKPETETTGAAVVTSSSSPKVSTTSGPPASCLDQLASCSLYSKAACQDEQWGRTYCARFCNLCS